MFEFHGLVVRAVKGLNLRPVKGWFYLHSISDQYQYDRDYTKQGAVYGKNI
jgi:hypothetical protein